MKISTRLFWAILVLTSMSSCGKGEDTCIGNVPPIYCLQNHSGHVISIVLKPASMQLPDSLVIWNGQCYSFEEGAFHYGKADFFFGAEFESRTVYYDGRYKLAIDALPADRQFQNPNRYKKEPDTYNPYIFTFLPQDYQFAVKNGQDLDK